MSEINNYIKELENLAISIDKAVKILQENCPENIEVMNRLPLLDFYNDDLKRAIKKLKEE